MNCGSLDPWLPAPRPNEMDSRPRIPHRAYLSGIVFVLDTGIQREDQTQDLGCGSGMTCWRRLRDWHEVGVWQRLHRVLPGWLGDADQIDWSPSESWRRQRPGEKGAMRLRRIRRIARRHIGSWTFGPGSGSLPSTSCAYSSRPAAWWSMA